MRRITTGMRRRVAPLVLVVGAVVRIADPGATRAEPGADGETGAATETGTFTFQFENDKFTNADRHYTNGVRAAWTSPRLREQLPWIGDALDWIYPFDAGADARIGVHLGQSMFTPDDISARQLISDDRPYAGWLYTGASLHAEAEQQILSRDFNTLDTLEIDIGMVGPASLAEQTQKLVHDITGAEDPKGWSHQLNNEPGIILTLERKWRPKAHDFGIFGLEADLIPSAAASVGNVNTSAGVAALLRFGQGVHVDYGPPLIRPNISGVSFIDRVPAGYAWYVFGGAGGRFVARDIFLDGNTFTHSHSVDKKLLVGNAQAGVAIVVRGVRIAFTQVWLTKEFDGQKDPELLRIAERLGPVLRSRS